MAIVSDLTFQQLNDAAFADPSIGENIFSLDGDTIYLNINLLTGDSFSALTNSGVMEMAYKLRKICGDAQVEANETIATNVTEELKSFPGFTFGTPSANGNVPVTHVSTYNIPLGINSIKGTN